MKKLKRVRKVNPELLKTKVQEELEKLPTGEYQDHLEKLQEILGIGENGFYKKRVAQFGKSGGFISDELNRIANYLSKVSNRKIRPGDLINPHPNIETFYNTNAVQSAA